MDPSRVTALALAFLAMLFVIIAGKSCADNINETNKLAHKQNTASTDMTRPDSFTNHADEYMSIMAENTEPTETETEKTYEEITNMLGDVIETVPITKEDETIPTTKEKSMLEAYNERHEQKEKEEREKNSEPGTTTFDFSSIEIPSEIEIFIN